MTLCAFVFALGQPSLIRKENLHRAEELEAAIGGESCVVQALIEYQLTVDSPVHKSIGAGKDYFLYGCWCVPVLLRYGDLETYRAQHARLLGYMEELGFSKTSFMQAPYQEYVIEGIVVQVYASW